MTLCSGVLTTGVNTVNAHKKYLLQKTMILEKGKS